MSISRQEAVRYLTEILGISTDMIDFKNPTSFNRHSSLVGLQIDLDLAAIEKRAKLLQCIITNYLAIEPFQSISLMSVDPSRRKRPEWDEIKESSFSKQGGLCYSLNSFMFALLRSLGFEVSLAHATVVCGVSCPDNHIVVLIHSLMEKDDLHLVDVGVGFPIFRAVPLDFSEESPVYLDSYHTYKFFKRSRNRIVLLQKPVKSVPIDESFNWGSLKGELDLYDKDFQKKLMQIHEGKVSYILENSSEKLNPHNNQSEWREFFFFDPTEMHTTLEEFRPCFDLCYGDVTKLSMHTSPRALSWPQGRLLAILHSKLTFENETEELLKFDIKDIPLSQKKESLPSRDQETRNKSADANVDVEWALIQVYQRFYPQFSKEMVESAILNWKVSGTGTAVKLPAYLT